MRKIEAVSVIMPAYNAMPFVKDAVESILAQSHCELELVIVDDGSTDETGSYLDSLTDGRVRVFHQTNQGNAAASNRALDEARCDWVARMDADDVALPQRIEKEVAFLQQYCDYGLVSCGWGYVGSDGRRLRATHFPRLLSSPRYQPLMDDMILHPGMLYEKRAVTAAGGYRGDIAIDLDLCLRLDEAGCLMASLPEALMLVRVLPGGMSSRNYVRQRVASRYAVACSLARRQGESAPQWEAFCREHWPRGWKRLRTEGARQFRMAGARWSSRRPLAAAARLLLSFILRPDYVLSKFRLYFFSGRRPKGPSGRAGERL